MRQNRRQTILERIQDICKEKYNPSLSFDYNLKALTNEINKVNININEKCSDSGDTALIMALKRDRSSLAKILLDIGTDINVKNRFEELAYKIACKKTNSYKEIAALIQEKIEKKTRLKRFFTPWCRRCKFN